MRVYFQLLLSLIFSVASTGAVRSQSAQPQSIRVALVQSGFEWGDTEANILAFGAKVDSIGSSERCDLIILPELFTSGCDMQRRDRALKVAQKERVAAIYLDIIETMRGWALSSGAVIVGSTIYSEGGLFYNRLLAVYPDGHYLHYDKHNCFKMSSFSPGEEHLVIDVKGHRLATYICYDLQFSEWSRNDGRYDSAIYIANWPTSRADSWDSLLRERAVENGAYVIGVNCVGVDLGGVSYMGNSSLYSPQGECIARCKSGGEEVLVVSY